MNHVAKITTWFGVIISGLLLTGCATGPKYSDYRATLQPRAAGMGRIWFYRHSVVFGDAIDPAVKLDGTKIGNSIPGSFFQVQTTPGVHEVSTATEATYKTTVTVSTNTDSYVKFHVLPGAFVYRVVPSVVNEAEAVQEMGGLRYAR
jgi:hypothetical protein